MKKAIIIILSVLLILCPIFYFLYIKGFFVTDYSAKLGESNRLLWQGRTYWGTSNCYGYDIGRLIVKGEPNLKLYEIENDPEHNYFFSSGFRDSELYRAEDYDPEINKGGKVRLAVWGGNIIQDFEFLKAITEIEAKKKTNLTIETDAIGEKIPNKQEMFELHLAYEKSPAADIKAGYLGKINGRWAITTNIPNHQYYDYEDGEIHNKRHIVECYLIPEKYHDLLQKISSSLSLFD